MTRFERITDRIYRLKVPFMSVYTAVFLIKCKDSYVLVDAATTSEDALLIVDALKDAGVRSGQISHILITHAHGDHAGGLRYLCDMMPQAVVCAGSDYLRRKLSLDNFDLLSDGREISDGIFAVSLPGHSADSYGYLDKRDGTLISGDAVQLCGIGKYGTGLSSFEDYFATLDKIDAMKLDTLVCSHDYYPHGCTAEGEEIARYISDSESYARYICTEIDACVSRGLCDAVAICEIIKEKNRSVSPDMPQLQVSTVRAYLNKEKR